MRAAGCLRGGKIAPKKVVRFGLIWSDKSRFIGFFAGWIFATEPARRRNQKVIITNFKVVARVTCFHI